MLIQILSANISVAEFRTASPVVVGRQSVEKNEEGPYRLLPALSSETARLIVAPFQTETISRRTLSLEPRGPSRVAIRNLSRSPLVLQTETTERIEPGMEIERNLPFDLL